MNNNLDFSRPLFMGIVNLTPDSFSDGGLFANPESALLRIQELIKEGADIIDIGAESTADKTHQVSADQEISRLKPVLESLDQFKGQVLFSVDTWKSQVAEFALSKGVHMINDVTALRGDPNMINVLLPSRVIARSPVLGATKQSRRTTECPLICLMYSSHTTPYAQKVEVQWSADVMSTIKTFLSHQADLLISHDFPKSNIIIDPGMGMFLSSDPAVSFEVVNRLSELKDLGFPILVGHSMKSFLGDSMDERRKKSVELGKLLLKNGANILRVHRVKDYSFI